MSYTSRVRRALLKRPQGTRNLVILGATGLLGLGIALSLNWQGSNTQGNLITDTVFSFLEVETSSGVYQKIAGTTSDGTIWTESGSFSQGVLSDPNCRISSTGAIQLCEYEGAKIDLTYLSDEILNGTGATNQVPFFTGVRTLSGADMFWDDANTRLGIGTASPNTTLDAIGDISVGGSNNELRFYEGINYVGFEAPALSSNQIWVLPNADGGANELLQTSGGGDLGWTTNMTWNAGATTLTLSDSIDTLTLNIDRGNSNITATSSMIFTSGNLLRFIVGSSSSVTFEDSANGVLFSGNNGGISYFRRLIIESGEDILFSQAGSDLIMGADNNTIHFGASNDAHITFDGNSLNIVANAVTATDEIFITAANFLIDTTGVQIITSDSGFNQSADADELILESAGKTGMTITSGASDTGTIYFGDSNNNVGGIVYNHNGNILSLLAGDTEKVIISGDETDFVVGIFKMGTNAAGSGRTDGVRKLGRIFSSHFFNASEEPIIIFLGDSDGTNNIIGFGDGSSLGNKATEIRFSVAANDTTPGSGSVDNSNFKIISDTTVLVTGDSQQLCWGLAQDGCIEFDGDSFNIVANGVTATDNLILTANNINVLADGSINGVTITTRVASNNFAIGNTSVMDAITSGTSNIAFGTAAGTDLTEGSSNMLFGAFAGFELTTGGSNLAIGAFALQNNTIGDSNVALGAGAMRGLNAVTNTPEGNIAIGSSSLTRIDTGTGNVVIGTGGGNNLTSGSINIFIGNNVAQNFTTESSRLVIDNMTRASVAATQTDAIIFGVMATNPINQTLAFNALVGIGVAPLTNATLTLEGGILAFKETTTPIADTNYGKIYTKDNNELFFQSGDGAEHLLHGDAFSNLWFHDVSPDPIGIGTAALFTLIDSFENIGEQDDLGNAIANTTNNDITVGTNGAGKYSITFHVSISSATAASEMIIAVGITLATPIDVTDASNTTPIIITSVAHGLLNGDMVTIAGTTGNDADGDWVVTAKTDDTFTLVDLTGSDSAGSGTYDASSGDVTVKFPGNILMHREVGFGALGVGGANADTNLAVADKVKLYVANVTSTRDLLIAIVNMEIFRIGD